MYTGETDRAKGCHWERGRELERETDRAEWKVVTVTITTLPLLSPHVMVSLKFDDGLMFVDARLTDTNLSKVCVRAARCRASL